MHSISFDVSTFDEGSHEVVPVIDGIGLVARVIAFERTSAMDPAGGYAGLVPEHFRFGPALAHYLPTADGVRRVAVLGCECGEWGCWPLVARVLVTDTSVTWQEFEQPHRPERDYSGFGPFMFGRLEYEAAVSALEPAWSAP